MLRRASGAASWRDLEGRRGFTLRCKRHDHRIVGDRWVPQVAPCRGQRPGQREAGALLASQREPGKARPLGCLRPPPTSRDLAAKGVHGHGPWPRAFLPQLVEERELTGNTRVHGHRIVPAGADWPNTAQSWRTRPSRALSGSHRDPRRCDENAGSPLTSRDASL